MGSVHNAKCKNCNKSFEFSEGGGFTFAIINCNSCHKARSVSWEEKEKKEVHGNCECGGTFVNDAKPRCPNCDSLNIKDLGVKIYFD